MKIHYIYIFLFFNISVSYAQTSGQAQLWADSAEFLIHENFRLEEAIKLNNQAAVLFRKETNAIGLVHCQINEIIYHAQRNDYAAGLSVARTLTNDIAKLDSNHVLLGRYYQAVAWCHWEGADYKQALIEANKAIEILALHQDYPRYVDALIVASYAIYFDKNGHFESINQYIEDAYDTANRHIDPSRQVFRYVYQLYGAILYQQGQVEKGINITREGLDYEYELLRINHAEQDSMTVAQYYNNLGRMYAMQNDIEQALAYYNNAYLLYRALDAAPELVKVCARLGELYVKQGKNEAADRFYTKILEYKSQLPSSPIIQQRNNSYNHISMANYFLHFALYDSLIQYYQTNMPSIVLHDLAVDKAYENIGLAYEQKRDFSKAIVYIQQALDYAQKKYEDKGTKVAEYYFDIGRLYLEEGEPEKAISYMDDVVETLNTSDFSEGDKLFLLETLLDKTIALKALEHRAKAQLHKGEIAKAHEDFNKVIVLANYLKDNYSSVESKTLSINQLRPIYENIAVTSWELFLKKESTAYQYAIFDYAEQSRSTLLNEQLLKFRGTKALDLGVPSEVLHKEEELMVRIGQCKNNILEAQQAQNAPRKAKHEAELLSLGQRLDSFEQALKDNYPNYKNWQLEQNKITSLKEVQKTLDEHTVFIEYFISEFHCFVVYITAAAVKVKCIEKFRERELKRRIIDLRKNIANISYILQQKETAWEGFVEEASWVYEHLVKDSILTNKNHLIIVPDDYLNYIPFEVLLTSYPKDKNNYQGLPYLIRDYSIHYEYSATVMVNNHANHTVNKTNGILGIGAVYDTNYVYNELNEAQKEKRTREEVTLHNDASPIVGVQEEIEMLERFFEGEYVYGAKATEATFKEKLSKQQYSVVHLAMHGLIDYKNANYSCLMFTEDGNPEEDNLLYAYEVQHLAGNNANLVVLSACQTGFGKYESGEGIISMGRSFMYAGVPSVVMTLWELSDQTSVQVMQLFYANLVAGMPKHLAMQKAKLSFLEQQSGLATQPFFWASFICIGNQEPIRLYRQNHHLYLYIGGAVVVVLSIVFWLWRKKSR